MIIRHISVNHFESNGKATYVPYNKIYLICKKYFKNIWGLKRYVNIISVNMKGKMSKSIHSIDLHYICIIVLDYFRDNEIVITRKMFILRNMAEKEKYKFLVLLYKKLN